MSEAAASRISIVRNVSKRFGATTVLDRVDLTIRRGELVTLLGPSGCGKTTLLRVDRRPRAARPGPGRACGARHHARAAARRNVGVVFQSYALFPHLTVAGNVAFGLKVRGLGQGRDRQRGRARAVAGQARASRRRGASRRCPAASSSASRWRARSRSSRTCCCSTRRSPRSIASCARRCRSNCGACCRTCGATAIFVTHDQDEALTMSDRVAVMNKGRIEQLAEPRELYSRPASLFALNFVGLSTRIAGTVVGAQDGKVEVDTRVGRLVGDGHLPAGSPVVVAARPEQLRPTATAGCERGLRPGSLGRVPGLAHAASRSTPARARACSPNCPGATPRCRASTTRSAWPGRSPRPSRFPPEAHA